MSRDAYRCPGCGTEVRDTLMPVHLLAEGQAFGAVGPSETLSGRRHGPGACRRKRRRWRAHRARMIDAGREAPTLPWDEPR